MANVHDVAACILQRKGTVTAMKLQKLVYYAQAWSLVWDERPLFDETIEAWANGPVVPELYKAHRGQFCVRPGILSTSGDPEALDCDEQDTVDVVLKFYGDKTAQWLSALTHMERPWREARGDVPPGEPSHVEITKAAMAEYYGSL